MSRSLKVRFADGSEEVLEVLPGAPGDREHNFSFRGKAFSGSRYWHEARTEAIERIESDAGKKVASLGD
jgi:hypothetical protein